MQEQRLLHELESGVRGRMLFLKHQHIVNKGKMVMKPKFIVIGFCSLFWRLTVHNNLIKYNR